MDIEKVKNELDKLDKDYFHTCIDCDKWSVYYKNMNDKNYLNKANKPILNSLYNNVEDINILNKRFNEIKEKAEENIFLERFDLKLDMFKLTEKISYEISKIFTMISNSILAFIIFLFIIENNVLATIGISMLTMNVILLLVTNYVRDNIDKYIVESNKKEEERLIKIYLKDKDMKGLRHEFTKKNRKKFIEENKKYRPKREKIQSSMERLERI